MNDAVDGSHPAPEIETESSMHRSMGMETAVWRRTVGEGRQGTTDIEAGDRCHRSMEGLSLTALVADARQVGRRYAMPLISLIEVFHKAAVQIARAHDRLVLHGSLDPDKLLVGRFGEVVLTDWSSPRALEPVRTPWSSLSSGERLGPEDDLYALCACMWYALHLEPPEDGVREPSERLPSNVRVLLVAGLSPDPAGRFRDAHRLVSAIRALAPSGYRFNSNGELVPFQRRRAWILAWTVAISMLVAAVMSAVIVMRPVGVDKTAVVPSSPVLREEFLDDSWKGRWRARGDAGQFVVHDGALVNTSESSILVLDRIMPPPASIEFTGEMPLGSDPGDLSVVWGEGNLLDPLWTFPHAAKLPDAGRFFLFQNGAYDNTFSCIQQSADGVLASVAYQQDRLDVGRRYRIRVDISQRSVAMWRDGRLVGRHEFDVALRPGTFALYLYHPGKQVRDIRVWLTEPLPDPLLVGDAFLSVGAVSAAADAFRGVMQSKVSPQIVDAARYRLGLAHASAGDQRAAQSTWAELRDPSLVGCSRLNGVEALVGSGDHDAALGILEDVFASFPNLRGQVAVKLAAILGRVTWDQRFEDYIRLRERLLPNDDITGICAARYLGWRNMHEQVVARYSRYRSIYLDSLFALGDLERVERDGSDIPGINVRLALERGQFDLLASRPGGHVPASCLLGRGADMVAAHPGDPLPLMYEGRVDEAANCTGPSRLVALARRWQSGSNPEVVIPSERLDVLMRSAHERVRDGWCDARLGAEALLRAHIQGRSGDERSRLREMLVAARARQDDPLVWFHQSVLPAYLQALDGRPEAMDGVAAGIASRQRDRFGQRSWYFAQRLRGLIDDAAFCMQPARVEARAWLALADAMAADLKGDYQAGLTHWSALAKLPSHQRCFGGIEGSGVIDLLVAWRCSFPRP